MQGAVAAGHPASAEAGAAVLRRGGNAVDACVAAAAASWVVEGPLSGPAGGGFALVRAAGETVLLDCFFAVPRNRLAPRMDEVVIDFEDASTQTFHTGRGSVAVPGVVAGLAAAHERFGSLPWAELFAPALELAQGGFVPSPQQEFLYRILIPILLTEEGGRRIYGAPGHVHTADVVGLLEDLRDTGADAVGRLLPELAADLAAYRVEEREVLEANCGGLVVHAAPAPSIGGGIVTRALAELGALPGWGSAVDLVRSLESAYGAVARPAPLTGTTHVSAIDREGLTAGLSTTLGSGSGVFREGTQLNNMLGELDVIGDGPREPGERLPSMMTPTLVLDGDEPRLLVGSAGSVRLAAAIAQVVRNVARGMAVEEAIDAPRLFVEQGVVHAEGGVDDADLAALERAGRHVNAWSGRNLFFGGASAVERRADGALAAAGDPRRGGAGVVVAQTG